ncbi:hypothetical protein D3C77_672640 [compost metagenome]
MVSRRQSMGLLTQGPHRAQTNPGNAIPQQGNHQHAKESDDQQRAGKCVQCAHIGSRVDGHHITQLGSFPIGGNGLHQQEERAGLLGGAGQFVEPFLESVPGYP